MNETTLEPDENGMVSIHTTVDMLIERLNDYPGEFFNEGLLPLLDAVRCLEGTKWRRLTAHLCNPTTTGMFTLEEKQRFAHALDVKMREAMDVRIVKALVTGEPFNKSDEPPAHTMGSAIGNTTMMTASQNSRYQNVGIQSGGLANNSLTQLGTQAYLEAQRDYERQHYEQVNKLGQARAAKYDKPQPSMIEQIVKRIRGGE